MVQAERGDVVMVIHDSGGDLTAGSFLILRTGQDFSIQFEIKQKEHGKRFHETIQKNHRK